MGMKPRKKPVPLKSPKRKETLDKYYTLAVSYDLSVHDWGSLDKQLEKAVGQHSDGAGTGFGARDIDWSFDTKRARDTARKRVDALGLEGISVDVAEYTRDGDIEN